MLITYRRTGGLFTLVTVAAVAVAATVATVAVAATVLTVAAVGASGAVLVRALLPRSWRRQVPLAPSGPPEIIEGTVVAPADDKE